MSFLMDDVTFAGHTQLPLISLLGAFGLIAASVIFSWRLLVQVTVLHRAVHYIYRRVSRLLTLPPEEIDEVRLRKLTEIFDQQRLFAPTWGKYRRSLLLDTSRWYETPKVHATQTAADVFTHEALCCRLNIAFYRSFPAMLTGAGLLLTFLAFFVGLSKIQILGTTVSGLPGLINGLSGKFVTSIVGLFCASIFAILEKIVLHRLLTTYRLMVDQLDQVFPHRTPSELLFEMTQQQGETARLLKYLGLDLAQHFRKSLTEAMSTPFGELKEAVRGIHTVPGNPPVERGVASRTSDPALLSRTAPAAQTIVFERLEASAVRQEHLLARLADILLPWTEILPKTRLPGSFSSLRRPSQPKSPSLSEAGHSA